MSFETDITEIKQLVEDRLEDIDPKFLRGIAHKAEYMKVVWWYSVTTGDLLATTKPRINHNNEFFKSVAYKPGYISGRVSRYDNTNILMVYDRRITETAMVDLLHKLVPHYIDSIDYIVDGDGKNLSHTIDNVDEAIKSRFNIKRFR